jgi:parallel beta-helix repeat protein
VTDCTFTNNSEDIAIGSSSGTMDLEISGCTIDKTGSSGSGVYLSNYHGGVTLEGNTITGTSGANNGIHTGASISGFQAVLLDNTIHGFTNGSGIRVDGGASPELRGNTIRDCLYGIRVDNGNPAVGTGSSSSDNFIHDNGYGVYAISSSAAPAIRNSRIYDNDRGVYCISNGATSAMGSLPGPTASPATATPWAPSTIAATSSTAPRE